VVTVIVPVTGVAPVTRMLLVVPNEHVGSSFVPAGAEAIAHCRFTWPVNPPAGVTVIVELPLAPRLAIVTCVPVTVKPAGVVDACTVTARFAVAVVVPEAAVTAIV
jgi:hypothetical protein